MGVGLGVGVGVGGDVGVALAVGVASAAVADGWEVLTAVVGLGVGLVPGVLLLSCRPTNTPPIIRISTSKTATRMSSTEGCRFVTGG